MSLRAAAFLFLVLASLQAQPRILPNGAVNAASFLSPATPGGAIAQGSIFTVFGENLGPRGLEARELPLPTTLGGVEALIFTGEGENYRAPLLYVGANQINAILPSAVPPGRHLLRIQRDGMQSNDQFIKVVEASAGLFFAADHGVPVVAAQANIPFGFRRISLATPAGPGSVVTLWGTGLGPSDGPDDQQPLAIRSEAEMEVLLAGQAVSFHYAGRSTCCAGLDQINVEIPPDAPTGCVVPLAVRVNGNVSNHVSLPITANGGPCDPNLGFRTGRLELLRQWTGDVAEDRTRGLFGQPLSPLDPARLPPEGSCMVWRPEASSGGSRWFDVTSFAAANPINDAGAISLTTPAEVLELAGNLYTPDPPATSFLGPGGYAARGAGGESFPSFQATLNVSPAPVLEAFDPKSVFARSTPANVRWFGGDATAAGVLWTGLESSQYPEVVCRASVAASSFQVQPYVWANQFPGERLYAFGAQQSAELMLPTDGPDHGLFVHREEFLETGDLSTPHLAATPVSLPNGDKVLAELAATASERARGLMERPVLGPDKGMLFLFETEGVYSFWMLNTRVPLDIIWMNSDREILFINADTPPCQTRTCPSYGPNVRSRYVLELAAGEAAQRGLKVGDKLEW